LPDKDWFNLDQFLFNIDDPIARAFMPRYLVAAVKRACEPACEYRQIPVLIGKQWIGKTKLGKSLFGHYFGSGVRSNFSVDDATKLERLWCCELAELDGLTRTAQIEAFKDFVSRTEDYERRKYGRDTERIPRRNVFWGTANNPPLNDKTGTTRFVCIALPEVLLPLDRVSKAFDAIWTRAYYEYRSGYQCYSTAEEMKAIQERNANYSIVDPWHDSIEDFVENSTLSMIEYSRLYELLDLDASRRKNLDSIRIRQIMESLGWHYDRRRIEGDQKRGFFKTK
jgi:predicted P-loop ATPase